MPIPSFGFCLNPRNAHPVPVSAQPKKDHWVQLKQAELQNEIDRFSSPEEKRQLIERRLQPVQTLKKDLATRAAGFKGLGGWFAKTEKNRVNTALTHADRWESSLKQQLEVPS